MAVKILNGIDVDGSMNIAASDVPNLDASKITSGTFSTDRIPNLSGVYQPAGDYLTLGTAETTFQPLGNYLTSVPAEYLTQTEGDARYLQSLPSHNHDTLYDAIGSADAVNLRIDEQVFPALEDLGNAIPTNNNQLTNGAGYITSANGGNAATLEGRRANDFLKSNDTPLSNTNLDTLYDDDSTLYYSNSEYSTNTNIPHQNYFTLLNFRNPYLDNTGDPANANDRASQLWLGDTPNTFYVRYYQGSAGWHPWEKVWTDNSFSDTNVSNWNTAYGWGNHDSAGYLKSIPASYATDAEVNSAVSVVNDRIDTEILPSIPTNNNQLTNGAGYITGYTETDTLDSVVSRNGSTGNQVNLSSSANRFNGHHYFDQYDSAGNHYPHYVSGSGGAVVNTRVYRNATQWRLFVLNGKNGSISWDGNELATQSYVTTQINNVIDSAPGALNTLNELAAALGDDANFSTTVANSIGAIDSRIETEVLPYIDAVALDASKGVTAHGWGDHRSVGYLTTLPSHNHDKIVENSIITYGQGSLQWMDVDGTGGTGYAGNTAGNPFNDWHHHIIMNHANSGGYYVDMAFSFHNDRVHFRRKAGGGNNNLSSWREFWHTGNFNPSDKASTESVAALDERINSEVLPAIPTNNNQLTNGAGYLTSLPNNAATFTNNIYLGNSATTANFITELTNLGAFQENYKSFKVAWDYAGNSNLDVGFESVELAGCLIECWGGTYKHVRLTRPTTGTGGRSIYVYNDQGSTYAPGWRQIWTSDEFGQGNINNWNTAHGWGNHSGLYDTIGSAGEVDNRIETEIKPLIDTVQATAESAQTTADSALTTAQTAETRANSAKDQAAAALPLAGGTITGSLTVAGSQTRGTYTTLSQYHSGADNIVLKGNASGISSIFFESEKDGTNINHPSDFGFIQYHAYGTSTSGESNELIIGVSNDADDHVILNAPNVNGLKFRTGVSETDYTVYHSGNLSLATLGYTGATNANYITNNNQLTNGAGYATEAFADNAAGIVNTRIEEEILPSIDAVLSSIPTNNNQLTNGAGYLTSSNDRVYITDSRGAARAPSYYNDRYAQWDFQNQSDTGAGGDSWHALLTVSKWSVYDNSHKQEQLIFTGDNLKRRTATSDSAWGTIKTIWDTGNLGVGDGGLTQKNFTTALKTKLDGIAAGATNVTNNNQLTNGAGYATETFANNAAVAVDTRINEEVLPAIPTNNNQLTNGAGYVTSSHTHTPSQVGLSNLSANGNSLAGNFTATGDITAFSDARVKENIETLPNALESVKQMRGVTYNKIGEEKQSIGVIAQELEEVVPQLVHTDEEGMKSVAYGNITALLIEALKEQQEQIEELKAKLNGLTK